MIQPDCQDKKGNEAVLEHECGWHPELAAVGGQISRLEGFKDFSKHQVIRQVGDRADAVYRKLWTSCSNEERLMLVNVARGALVNPRNTDTLHRLLRRGLIRRHGFELPCESFRHFVLSALPPEQLHRWQQAAERRSLWTALKIPLALILVVVGGFLFFTEREVFDATVAFAAALVAGLSALLGLLSLVRDNGDDTSGNS